MINAVMWAYCSATLGLCSIETFPDAAGCLAQAPAGYECVRLEVGTDGSAVDWLWDSLW